MNNIISVTIAIRPNGVYLLQETTPTNGVEKEITQDQAYELFAQYQNLRYFQTKLYNYPARTFLMD